jgi:hypothetical protein
MLHHLRRLPSPPAAPVRSLRAQAEAPVRREIAISAPLAISAAAVRAATGTMSAMASRVPSAAWRAAAARPMPRAVPVIGAVLPRRGAAASTHLRRSGGSCRRPRWPGTRRRHAWWGILRRRGRSSGRCHRPSCASSCPSPDARSPSRSRAATLRWARRPDARAAPPMAWQSWARAGAPMMTFIFGDPMNQAAKRLRGWRRPCR